jgi:hypothetical protein
LIKVHYIPEDFSFPGQGPDAGVIAFFIGLGILIEQFDHQGMEGTLFVDITVLASGFPGDAKLADAGQLSHTRCFDDRAEALRVYPIGKMAV